MSNILALDLGTNCGWAVDAKGCVESGVQLFDVKRGESPGMRYLRFNSWLKEFQSWHLELIVYEQTLARFAKGGSQSEIAAGFATRVQEFCAKNSIEHTAVHGSTLKKFATGHGNSKKPDMILAAQKLKAGVENDNESDALWLLEFAKRTMVTA